MVDFSGIREKAAEHFQNAEAPPEEPKEEAQSEPQDDNQPHLEAKEESAPTPSPSESAQAILDLEKAEKFLIGGKEYTWKQLQSERMLQSDYTRKTQAFAKEREQFEQQREMDSNFRADLPKILSNPQRLYELAQHYPKEYVDLARQYLELTPAQQRQVTEGGSSFDLNGLERILENRLKPLVDRLDQTETSAVHKQLDATFTAMQTKYPGVDEEFVLARLQGLRANGRDIDDQQIEDVFKSLHERDQQRLEGYHKERLLKQSEANKKARDSAPGGGIPGQAPKKLKLGDVGAALRERFSRD